MKLIPVKEIPHRRDKKKLIEELTVFEKIDAQVVKVEYNENEYGHPSSCYSAFSKAIKASGYSMKVLQKDGQIYIIKLNKEL